MADTTPLAGPRIKVILSAHRLILVEIHPKDDTRKRTNSVWRVFPGLGTSVLGQLRPTPQSHGTQTDAGLRILNGGVVASREYVVASHHPGAWRLDIHDTE